MTWALLPERTTGKRHAYTVLRDAATKVFRIEISTAPKSREKMLQHLHRMNMSTSTLFPGIQGFARSLENILVFPDILEYGDNYESDFPI